MKKLIITLFILSHSFLAMADDNVTKIELLNFVHENAKSIGIDVSDNNITNIYYNMSPELLTLENFDDIIRLDFSNTNITYLPPNLYLFKNLREILVCNTNLKEIPPEIFDSHITYLDVSNNQIEYLPLEINKTKIYHLNVANNKLTEIPKDLGNLKLNYLNLSNNNISKIPNSFLNLKELRDLFLDNNKIEELPKNFFKIFEIQHPDYFVSRAGPDIDISNNKISFLDKSICEAIVFGKLNFYNNYFDKLPLCLTDSSVGNVASTYNINYIYSTSDINGTYKGSSHKIHVSEVLQQLGWQFADDVIIYYTYEDNKTLKFEPIYQVDMQIESYLWNFGDGNSSIEESPTHTYSNYGDYNVTLTINEDTNFSKLISIYPRVLELKKGWNMITPPTKDDINASLFETVWSYENGNWENSHSYLIPTIGYWVKLNEDLNYTYSGEVYRLPNYKIKSGWNLIGSGEKYFREENQTIYQFKNGNWIINPKEIKVGEGFWIKK